MKTYRIASIPGDGIGIEVIAEGEKVLKALAQKDGSFALDFTPFDWGSERFRREGVATPHNFFFAPGQFLKREQDWGPGEVMRRAAAEAARISVEVRSHMSIRPVNGPEAVAVAFRELVAHETPADVGVIATVGER